jgi:macrolide transport system ATP-binding/permease protein
MKRKAILRLKGVCRNFEVDGQPLTALRDIDLSIHAGSWVALVGPSGSGKSSLLNLLGCLDAPSSGSYRIRGHEVAALSSDARASLRRKFFGFVFQRYHLLPDLSAQENVEAPAIYARTSSAQRRGRAQDLLERLGLGDRLNHLPHQLSGGQQQRVSVARALMNGGEVLFADEPTGALDDASSAQLMQLLKRLQAQGHTVVMATHDARLAECADRIVELRDGRIVSDRANPHAAAAAPAQDAVASDAVAPLPAQPVSRRRASRPRLLGESFRVAVQALVRHRFRTTLTLLGIVVGIASLVSVIAIGEGGQRRIRQTLGSLTHHTLEVYRGAGWGDARAPDIHTLVSDDLQALQEQPYIASVTPMTREGRLVRHEGQDAQATVSGVGESYFGTRGMAIAEGRAFSADETRRQAQVVVIDQATRARLFPPGATPLGQTLVVGPVPLVVVGVTSLRSQDFYLDRGLNLLVPYTTAGTKLFGRLDFDSISLRVQEHQSSALAEKAVNAVMLRMHGDKDFFTNNMDALAQAYASTTRSLSTMLAAIAAISLLVGGIGVMNIMLVSVAERTREIGLRMAVGARQSDILKQFLVEAVVVCLIGALMGVALALGIGFVFTFFVKDWTMVFTAQALVSALLSSTLTGITFGYLPARKASRLSPVDALARD